MVYVVNGIRFRALRACGAREAEFFFHKLNFFTKTFKLFYWSEALKSRFEVAYVVNKTHLSALRARGVREAEFFFMDRFLLPRRFQRGIARPQIPTHVQTPP